MSHDAERPSRRLRSCELRRIVSDLANVGGDPNTAPRCGAKTRRGSPCRCPALRGRSRCRLHGGYSTGPRTLEGLDRIRAANTRHGDFSAETRTFEKLCRELIADSCLSAKAMRDPRMRAYLMAHGSQIPDGLLKRVRELARLEVRQADAERLKAKGEHVSADQRPLD